MKYKKKDLDDAVLGFEQDGGGATWDAFNLVFEDEIEFIEHFNLYWNEEYCPSYVSSIALYKNGFNDYCVFHRKQDTVEIDSLVYYFDKYIFCIEG